jgi:hypothetical protein
MKLSNWIFPVAIGVLFFVAVQSRDDQASEASQIVSQPTEHAAAQVQNADYLDHDEIIAMIDSNPDLSRMIGGGIVDLDKNWDGDVTIRIWTPRMVNEATARRIAEGANQGLINMLMERGMNPKSDNIRVIARVWSRDVPQSPTGGDQVAALGVATYYPMSDKIEWRRGP